MRGESGQGRLDDLCACCSRRCCSSSASSDPEAAPQHPPGGDRVRQPQRLQQGERRRGRGLLPRGRGEASPEEAGVVEVGPAAAAAAEARRGPGRREAPCVGEEVRRGGPGREEGVAGGEGGLLSVLRRRTRARARE